MCMYYIMFNICPYVTCTHTISSITHGVGWWAVIWTELDLCPLQQRFHSGYFNMVKAHANDQQNKRWCKWQGVGGQYKSEFNLSHVVHGARSVYTKHNVLCRWWACALPGVWKKKRTVWECSDFNSHPSQLALKTFTGLLKYSVAFCQQDI